jgi:integrase
MASVCNDPGGFRRILFVDKNGKRRALHLGRIPKKTADEICGRVEKLNAAAISGSAVDEETARWAASRGDILADKLAAVSLIAERDTAQLGKFLDGYILKRTDVKSATRRNLVAARDKLVAFFGAEKNLRDIKPGDADDWKTWLKGRYAGATTGRAIKFGKQFFRVALRKKLVSENPFDNVKAPAQVNESRKSFISREDAQRVLDACPDVEWKLIFALSRYGGLRCPSETLALQWVDVDWERDRYWVPSPKTEGHEGHEGRWVPIFPELRPYFEEAFESAPEGAVHVISRYRDPSKNFRTRMFRIIKRAGLTPWPKLFHNLRATRETELAAQYPMHVVCSWIGNSALIAAKHYLQVTDDDFRRGAESGAQAAQIRAQQPAAPACTGSQETTEAPKGCEFAAVSAEGCDGVRSDQVRLEGFEPPTYGSVESFASVPKSPENPVKVAPYAILLCVASACQHYLGIANSRGFSARRAEDSAHLRRPGSVGWIRGQYC